jgi:hypothetical protein
MVPGEQFNTLAMVSYGNSWTSFIMNAVLYFFVSDRIASA